MAAVGARGAPRRGRRTVSDVDVPAGLHRVMVMRDTLESLLWAELPADVALNAVGLQLRRARMELGVDKVPER